MDACETLANDPPTTAAAPGMPAAVTVTFAVAVGVIVLSLFASQPMLALIAGSFGIGTAEVGLVTTLTLLGYAAGLILLVPLVDLVENRRLIAVTLLAAVAALAAMTMAPSVPWLFVASFAVGVTSSAIQMLVPAIAYRASEAERGKIVGNVMSGLMLGILLSRPAASMVAHVFGWRGFYAMTAVLVLLLVPVLLRALPQRRPVTTGGYGRLVLSLWHLLRDEPVLRRRAAYQGLLMGGFSVFWTAIAFRLAAAPFDLNQTGIALFAFAGAAGAVIAPLAGRAGDHGLTGPATLLAHVAVITGIGFAALGGSLLSAYPHLALGVLVLAAVTIDLGVIGDQTLGRRAINMIRPEARGRMNGLYTGLFFFGGAAGAALAGPALDWGGWPAACAVALGFVLAAFILRLAERRPVTTPSKV